MSELIQMIRDLTARLAAVADEFSGRAEAITSSQTPTGHSGDADQATRLARAEALLNERRLRSRFLPAELFHEPAWDMLLALYLSWHEGETLFVKTLVATSTAPITTSQRWIDHLAKLGLVTRVADPVDRRRIEVSLSQAGLQAVDAYLEALTNPVST